MFLYGHMNGLSAIRSGTTKLGTPDIVRLRYRQVLGEAIAAIVRSNQEMTEANVLAVLPNSVLTEDRHHLVELVLKELDRLHAGNAVRFGLRSLELLKWKGNFPIIHCSEK